jgi:GTP-binding protein HflX
MSAKRPEDVAKMHQVIVTFFQKDLIEAELFLPWTAQQLRGEIYASCQVLGERSDNEGAFFTIRGEASVVQGLREKLTPSHSEE